MPILPCIVTLGDSPEGTYIGYKNREIEFKLEVKDTKTSLARLSKPLMNVLDVRRVLVGRSIDVYWSLDRFRWKKLGTRGKVRGDFLRVRCLETGMGQVTLKEQDRGTYSNRVEIDVTTANPRQACELLGHLFGDTAGYIHKSYHVLFLEDEHTTVSFYKVHNDGRVFMEIEAKTMRRATQLLDTVTQAILAEVDPVNASLYDLVLRGKPGIPLSKIRLPMSRNKVVMPSSKRRAA